MSEYKVHYHDIIDENGDEWNKTYWSTSEMIREMYEINEDQLGIEDLLLNLIEYLIDEKFHSPQNLLNSIYPDFSFQIL